MRRLGATAILLGLLCPLAAAAQTPVDATWHSSGAVAFRGTWDMELRLASLEVAAGSALRGTAQQGQVHLFEEVRGRAEGPQPGVADGPPQEIAAFPAAGQVDFGAPAPGEALWLVPWKEGAAFAARAHGAVDAQVVPGEAQVVDREQPSYAGRILSVAGGGAALAAPGAIAQADGPLLVVAWGPTVSSGDRSEWTGCIPLSPSAPAGLLRCRYAVYESQGGLWDLRGVAATARLASARGTLVGSLAVDHVDAAQWNGTQFPARGSIFEAVGSFAVATTFGQDAATWRVQGTMASLKVDAAPVAAALRVAGWAAGAAGVGLAAWLLRPWAVGLFTRVCALGSTTRRRILEELRAHGGASAAGLARGLGLHKTSAEYHLEILARSGLVARERVANRFHYVAIGPLGHGAGPPLLGAALGEQPVRSAILAALAAGPRTTRELVACVRARADLGPGLSLFHYHAGILREHGVVQAVRRGRSYVWSRPAPEGPPVVDVVVKQAGGMQAAG
jgi:DNA-binding transcriptional ArsR family regulator